MTSRAPGVPRLSQSNLEYKAKVTDHNMLASAFEQMGAVFVGVLDQTDTYFEVRNGRLKLRESDAHRQELIFYDRDENSPRRMESHYEIVRFSNPKLKEVLSGALGVKTVVCKERRLYNWKNARIHLDEVKGLGRFLEFEVVSEEGALHEEVDCADDLQTLEALKAVAAPYIDREINCSYSDLMLAGKSSSFE